MLELKPAVLYLDQLNENLKNLTYSTEVANLTGNPLFDGVLIVDGAVNMDDCSTSAYKYAIVNNTTVIGYFTYKINWLTRAVGSIYLISFYERCPELGLLIYKEINRLIKKYHSVSWIAIDTCKALETYKKFVKRYNKNGIINYYPQSLIDTDGCYHDKYEFYIYNKV